MIECLGHLESLTWILYTRKDCGLFLTDYTYRIIFNMHGSHHDLLRMADRGLGLTFPDDPVLQGMSHGGCIGPELRETAARSPKGRRHCCRVTLSRAVVCSIYLYRRLMRGRERKRVGVDHHLRRVSLPGLRGE